VGRLAGGGQLGAGHEQLGLNAQEVGQHLGLIARRGPREAKGGGRLVDGSIGLRAQVRLGHTAPVPQAGGAVVALAGVDAHHRW
jgi:hypothetical protein